MSWKREAACAGQDTRRFFEPWAADEARREWPEEELAFARSFCWRCPVARECFEAAMEEECEEAEDRIFGVRGGTTPEQRIDWRKAPDYAWRCPNCFEAYEPRALVAGSQACSCGLIGTTLRAMPDRGWQFAERHSVLAAEVLRELRAVGRGAVFPSASAYAAARGIRPADVVRVYRALMEDGELVAEDLRRGQYRRA